MAMGPSRWKVITPSEFQWELEAFDYIRSQLPDTDPYQAWQGFNFISDTGGIYEVDLLILTPVGFFLIEVKSRPGVLGGDASTWTWKHDGHVFTADNPTILANSKAKKLIGLLRHQRALREIRSPFLEALVFCSAPGLQCELPESARVRLCLRDRPVSENHPARPGIIAALTSGCIAGVADSRSPSIDRSVMSCISRAMDQAGIRQSERYKVISDYRLKSLLMEGPGWQDWEGVHVSLPENRRRIRRYTLSAAASDDQRQTLLRAARREYQILDNLSHPGILGVKGFTDNEFGPALIFEHHPKAVRLDHFLAEAAGRLGIDARLGILRQIADAVRYAHGKRVFHRSLSPQNVLVTDPTDGLPRIRLFNWQTGSRDALTTSNTAGRAVTATIHIDQLVEGGTMAYMAPESFLEHDGGGEYLDIFSLGALAYHLFSGRPPAATFLEMTQRIRETGGLQISAAMDGAPAALQELVQYATHPEVASRYSSVDEFLKQLEAVEDEMTAPPQEETVHPHQANKGDRLDGGLMVKSQLGSGSTSVVLLVDDGGEERVLKVARSPDYNARLKEEAEVLNKLRHQYIVEVYRTVELHGLVGILMQRAGEETLTRRIKDDGHLHPDLLQRFGEDLLVTVDWLEQQGIPHRDLKPDNIGVMQVGRGKELHLVLFDFSLSRASPDSVRVGTMRYLDPFLTLRKPQRWDLAAERWSAAMTLYEMSVGDLPRWGDGRTDPAMLDCEATIDGDRFDPEVREGLLSFFTRALRRDPADRFDNCRDMLEAWRSAFRNIDSKTDHEDEPKDADELLEAATLETSVTQLGLPTRALTALDRLNINDVRELLSFNIWRLNRTRGVGNKTRRQIAKVKGKLKKRFPEIQPESRDVDTPDTTVSDAEGPVWSVERLVQSITGGAPARKKDVELKALRAFLNLDRLDAPSLGYWPTQTQVAAQVRLAKAALNTSIVNSRRRWQKNQSVTHVRGEIVETIESRGGAMTAGELARAVLATRGSNSTDDDQRERMASAVVRAAVEAETAMAQSRLATRRRGERTLVARVYDEDDPTALCDYAFRLGDEADKLATAEPLPTPQRVIESLRRVRAPQQAPYLTDNRLVALAAAASTAAAANSRLELYPIGMPAGRALKLAIGALAGAQALTLEQIRDRVQGRYPQAQPLPDRPELDTLLQEAGWHFKWDPAASAYRPPTNILTTTTFTSTLPRYPTVPAPAGLITPQVAEARQFEERLVRSLGRGAFLAMGVAPRHIQRAAADLADRFKLEVQNLDDLLIRQLQRQAESRRVDWNVVLKADAEGPEGRDWSKLLMLVRAAVEQVEKQLLESQRPALLMYPGLIARYQQLHFLEHLRDGCGQANKVPGLWLLVASDHQMALLTIDGSPVPVLGQGQWAWVPDAWLENLHRSDAAKAQ